MTDKEKKFIAIGQKIFRKYHVQLSAFKRDNRISSIMQTVSFETHMPRMDYNWNHASHYSLNALTNVLLHETFHSFKSSQLRPYNTKEEKIEEEYLAETFALNELKKINPSAYLQECKTMRNVLKGKSRRKTMALDHIHKTAYMRIDSYITKDNK
jgi:hypothetical protein